MFWAPVFATSLYQLHSYPIRRRPVPLLNLLFCLRLRRRQPQPPYGGLGACPQAGVSKGIFVRMWLYPAISGYVWLYLAISGYTSLRTTIRSETAQYMLMALSVTPSTWLSTEIWYCQLPATSTKSKQARDRQIAGEGHINRRGVVPVFPRMCRENKRVCGRIREEMGRTRENKHLAPC